MAGKPGWKHTAETRARISASKKGRRPTPQALENMRQGYRSRRSYVGDANPCWRGGSRMVSGRVYEYVGPGEKLVPRARRVASEHLCRPLLPEEDVHHKNEVKTDDAADNLEPRLHSEHARYHALKRQRDPETGKWYSSE